MPRPYEFADESQYRTENLAEIIKDCDRFVKQVDDPEIVVEVEHLVRHALFEYFSRKERDPYTTAYRIVRE